MPNNALWLCARKEYQPSMHRQGIVGAKIYWWEQSLYSTVLEMRCFLWNREVSNMREHVTVIQLMCRKWCHGSRIMLGNAVYEWASWVSHFCTIIPCSRPVYPITLSACMWKLTISIPATPCHRHNNRVSYRPTSASSMCSSRGCSIFEVHLLSIVCLVMFTSQWYSPPAPISLSFSLCHWSEVVR